MYENFAACGLAWGALWGRCLTKEFPPNKNGFQTLTFLLDLFGRLCVAFSKVFRWVCKDVAWKSENLEIRKLEDLKIRKLENLKIRKLENLKFRKFENVKIRKLESLKIRELEICETKTTCFREGHYSYRLTFCLSGDPSAKLALASLAPVAVPRDVGRECASVWGYLSVAILSFFNIGRRAMRSL